MVGQDGDEEVGPGPVGGLVEDRTQPQVGLERPEGAFDPGDGHIKRTDLDVGESTWGVFMT